MAKMVNFMLCEFYLNKKKIKKQKLKQKSVLKLSSKDKYGFVKLLWMLFVWLLSF